MQVLHELWHGFIRPAEHPPSSNAEYLRLSRKLCEEEKQLLALLDGEARQRFESFAEGENQLCGIVEEDSFCIGFQLAVRLIFGALTG